MIQNPFDDELLYDHFIHVTISLPDDGQFILFLLHPHVFKLLSKSGGYILKKILISLFVGACFLKRFEFVCILLRWRPSHCSLTDGVKFLK
jgi:hypothetical protein